MSRKGSKENPDREVSPTTEDNVPPETARILQRAQMIAVGLGLPAYGTEHLLLSFVEEAGPEGAKQIFSLTLGLEEARVREMVTTMAAARRASPWPGGEIFYQDLGMVVAEAYRLVGDRAALITPVVLQERLLMIHGTPAHHILETLNPSATIVHGLLNALQGWGSDVPETPPQAPRATRTRKPRS